MTPTTHPTLPPATIRIERNHDNTATAHITAHALDVELIPEALERVLAHLNDPEVEDDMLDFFTTQADA